jgi:hypothetical protein
MELPCRRLPVSRAQGHLAVATPLAGQHFFPAYQGRREEGAGCEGCSQRREFAWPIGLRQRAGLPCRVGPQVTAAGRERAKLGDGCRALGGIRALVKVEVLAGHGTYPWTRTRRANWSGGTSGGELPVQPGFRPRVLLTGCDPIAVRPAGASSVRRAAAAACG